MKKSDKASYEYQHYPECTVVAVNASLDDFKGKPVMGNTGQMRLRYEERTVKDCTKIDGCVYLHLGRVSDSIMCELIEKFQRALKDKEKGESMIIGTEVYKMTI